jgi:hypothetical protein
MKFLLDCNGLVTPTVMVNRLMQVVDKLCTGAPSGKLRTGETFWLIKDEDVSLDEMRKMGWNVQIAETRKVEPVRKPNRGKLDIGDGTK